jgi:hypothetical protein
MSEPFITLYTVDGRANKLVTRRRGKVTKKAGPPIFDAVARTIRVDTVDEMADLLRNVGEQESSLINLGCPLRQSSESLMRRFQA